MDKIKVLHIIGGGEFGGAEQHILSLMEEFRASPVDAEVITFYDAAFSRVLKERGLSVSVIEDYGRFDFRLYKKLTEWFRAKQPDIVHTHGVRANFFARLAGRKANVPHVVTTVHSIQRHDYPNPFMYGLTWLMESCTRSVTDRFIAVSQPIRKELENKGVPTDHIAVFQNGIDTSRYRASADLQQRRTALREEWNIPDEAIVVGTTARLVPVKDIPCLLQGFSLTLEKTPNLRLLIVGDGPERRELEKLTGDLDIREYVVFAGFRQDIPECLAAMDIYINTSRSEGQPISLMEAMASQKPVIVTEVGGMKEMITAGKTGLFIPPERPDAVREAIQRLVQNPSLMQKLGANGKALIEAHYSRKTLAESHVKLYEDLIKGTLSHVE